MLVKILDFLAFKTQNTLTIYSAEGQDTSTKNGSVLGMELNNI